jgi:FecR-like protein
MRDGTFYLPYRIGVVGCLSVLIALLCVHDLPAQEKAAVGPAVSTTAAPAVTSTSPENPKALKAVAAKVTGKFVQYSVDKGKTWKPLKLGVELGKGELVRTGFGSGCELRFGGHSVLIIQALSSVKVADYIGIQGKEIVRARLQYGALRCGVEKGRIEADTRISTPVSTLSIRGTQVYVSYDAGIQSCMLGVDEDGPAMARVYGGGCCGPGESEEETYFAGDPNQQVLAFSSDYELYEGMRTDCMLSRDLRLAEFDRMVWVTGNHIIGDISATEAETIVQHQGNIEPTEGARQYDDAKSIGQQRITVTEIDFPGGDIPIGIIIPSDDDLQ